MQIERVATTHDDGVGDICAIVTVINSRRTLLVSVCVASGTLVEGLWEFFVLEMEKHELKYYTHQLGSDTNLKSSRGREF